MNRFDEEYFTCWLHLKIDKILETDDDYTDLRYYLNWFCWYRLLNTQSDQNIYRMKENLIKGTWKKV